MTDFSSVASTLVDKFLASGTQVLDRSERVSTIGLSASKRLFDSQLGLGSALIELGAEQLKSLGDITSPKTLLQRQKDAAEQFGGKVQGYFEEVRGVAQEAQQAVVTLGEDAAADLGKAFKFEAADA